MFELLEVKWGPATYGTPSGTVNWSADLGDLNTATGVTENDLMAVLQSAFDAWEAVAAIDFEQVSSGGQVTVGGFIPEEEVVASGDGGGGGGGAGALALLLGLLALIAGFLPVGGAAAAMAAGQVADPDEDDDETGEAAATIAGRATWGPNIVGELNSLTIGIIEFNSELQWAEYGDGGYDFFAIALHEIGHIIGLDHVDDRSLIMNDVVWASGLGAGDIAGAQFIYGTGDGSAPAQVVDMPEDAALEELAANAPDIYDDGLYVTEVAFAPDTAFAEADLLPMVEHDCQPKACGCFGQCSHTELEDEDLFEWA